MIGNTLMLRRWIWMDGGEREEERNVEIDTLYALAVSLG